MSTAKRKKRSSSLKGSLNPSKRHRDRFNIELDNLAKLLPFPHDVIQKLDKLSILRLSASYLRAKNFFKGQQWSEDNVSKLAEVPTDFEGNGVFSKLLLEALDGFIIVLTRDFEVFYASETVQEYLGLAQASVIHQDFLRFIHVDDHDLIRKNLLPFPEEEEQKIRILDEENDGKPSESGSNTEDDQDKGNEVETERSFVCRMKCILNTSAGFFKPFRCSGRLREMTLPDSERREYGLFMVCTPLETVSSSMLEIRLKTSLFCTKNRMDLSFMDIDQKGRSLLGYHKRDIALQSSYCMIHFDDIPVLKNLHSDLMGTGKCQGTFRMLNKNLKWQWLTGTAQVVFKGNEPDFIITTNRPMSEEEGEEILRQRGQFPSLPFTASDCGSPSPRSPHSPGSFCNRSNGSSPHAFPWENFSVTRNNFKFPSMPPKFSNGRVKRKANSADGSTKTMSSSSGSTSSMQEDCLSSPQQHPVSPFPDAFLSSTTCTSAPLSPPLLDLGVDIQAELENDATDFMFLDPQDLTLDDVHLEPLENEGDELVSSMSLLAVELPTYEEALLLANDCLSGSTGSDSTGLTSPGDNQVLLSQSPPKGNVEHFSPTTPSPYPSPVAPQLGHPAPHISPGGLPTPDPSPLGHRDQSRASVNISWQGMGQMQVSNQPPQHCNQQQGLHSFNVMPSPQPQMQNRNGINTMSSKSVMSATIKKKERRDVYGPSCITGQLQNQGGMQSPQGNWIPQNIKNMQQSYDWKVTQTSYNPMQNAAAMVGSENPVYATNMQGGKWDTVTVPLFEDTLPLLDYDNMNSTHARTEPGIGQTQRYGWEPPVDILSPPYQEDLMPSAFGFQGNPLPPHTQEQTTLQGGW